MPAGFVLINCHGFQPVVGLACRRGALAELINLSIIIAALALNCLQTELLASKFETWIKLPGAKAMRMIDLIF